jgi:nicotinate-nucleotide--dimethylbenzimidazole phosphoribosyltransferase
MKNNRNKLQETIKRIKPASHEYALKAQNKLDGLTKPQNSLGILEGLAKRVVMMTENLNPLFTNKVIFTFAADHGVAREGVSAFPQEVTAQMVYNFIKGGAGINVLAKHAGAKVVVADLGVALDMDSGNDREGFYVNKINYGTKNITKGPAMTGDEALASIEAGIDIFEKEYAKKPISIAGTGDMGIGNTTPSSAITSVICGVDPREVTGRGTGIDKVGLKRKINAVKKAVEINNPDKNNAVDILAALGGFEIGGLAGVILAASSRQVPVVIDGFISGAAALIAYTLCPVSKQYMIAAHSSVEVGHNVLLKHIGLDPVLNLNLRLGEGTGAALAMNIVEAGCKILNEMATFESANVSNKSEREHTAC